MIHSDLYEAETGVRLYPGTLNMFSTDRGTYPTTGYVWNHLSMASSRRSFPSSPFDYAERGSPPLLIVHGDQDTLTSSKSAHALAERARNVSTHPVAYVELPGAQHSFDLLRSIRFEAVIDEIESFAAITAPDFDLLDPK